MKLRIYLISLSILSIATIVVLYSITGKPNQQNNGFNRLFVANPILEPISSFDTKSKVLYFAGVTEETIYLGNYFDPEQLISMNFDFIRKDTVKIHFPKNKRILWRAMHVVVDSPRVYAYEGITPSIFFGTLSAPSLIKSSLDKQTFSHCKPIGHESFILRTKSYDYSKNILKKVSLKNMTTDDFIIGLPNENQFSTDGILLAKPKTNRIIYVYFYKNSFLVLDTTLKIRVTGHTIDTVANSNVKAIEIKSERTFKILGQPLIVNKRADFDGDKLYINSNLKADNEQMSAFKNLIVIDVYDLNTSSYIHSFYLPKYSRAKLYEFKVSNNRIIAFFENHVVTYRLPK